MIRKRSVYTYSLVLLLLIPFIVQAGLTFVEKGFATSMIIRIGGVAELIPLTAFLATGLLLKTQRLHREYLYIYMFSVFGMFYSLVGIVIGIAYGNSLGYILGDTLRYSLPFASIFCLLSAVKSPRSGKMFIEALVGALVFLTICKLLGKIYLLLTGAVYGGGLNQFYLEPFLITVLFFGIVNNGISFGNVKLSKRFCFLFLLLALVCVVLSLKRGFWVVTFVMVLFNLIYFKRITKGVLFLLPLISLIFVYLGDTLLAEAIIRRFQYVFNGQHSFGLDTSSYERLAEIKGAFSVLGSNVSYLEHIFGRGSGAEFNAHPSFPLSKEQTGSESGYFHHIHNMYTILMFRHGLIGVLLYLSMPVLLSYFFYNARNLTKKDSSDFLVMVLFASLCQLYSLLISGISSNSIYGNGSYGIYLVSFVSAIFLIRDRSYEETKNTRLR